MSVENPPQIGKCLAAGERTRVGCVDLIVPVYKCAELARRCIDSILANISEIAAYSPRLIVINDSPGDPAVEELLQDIAAKHSGVVLLENPVNTGFVGAANRGLDIACTSGSDALLINADTETFPDTLRNLRDAAYSEPQVGFASPRSNNASLCSLPHPGGGPAADPPEAYRRWKVLSRTMPATHVVPTGVGFYLYIRHAMLANFGYLDGNFGIGYEEENDLIMRANKAGYRTVLANHAFAYHVGSASFLQRAADLSGHREANYACLLYTSPSPRD